MSLLESRCYSRSSAPSKGEQLHFNRGALLFMVLMASGGFSMGKTEVNLPADITITADQQGIRLAACEKPLWLLLERIEEKSGVRIGVEGHVGNQPVCVDIGAETWSQLLDVLLKAYDKIVVHEADGSVSRVLVLNHGNPNAQGVTSSATGGPTAQAGSSGDRQGDKVAHQGKAGAPRAPTLIPADVPPPPDPALSGSEGPSVFLRGLTAPPDTTDLPSPPVELYGAGGGQNLGRERGSVTVAAEHPPLAVPPEERALTTEVPR